MLKVWKRGEGAANFVVGRQSRGDVRSSSSERLLLPRSSSTATSVFFSFFWPGGREQETTRTTSSPTTTFLFFLLGLIKSLVNVAKRVAGNLSLRAVFLFLSCTTALYLHPIDDTALMIPDWKLDFGFYCEGGVTRCIYCPGGTWDLS